MTVHKVFEDMIISQTETQELAVPTIKWSGKPLSVQANAQLQADGCGQWRMQTEF